MAFTTRCEVPETAVPGSWPAAANCFGQLSDDDRHDFVRGRRLRLVGLRIARCRRQLPVLRPEAGHGAGPLDSNRARRPTHRSAPVDAPPCCCAPRRTAFCRRRRPYTVCPGDVQAPVLLFDGPTQRAVPMTAQLPRHHSLSLGDGARQAHLQPGFDGFSRAGDSNAKDCVRLSRLGQSRRQPAPSSTVLTETPQPLPSQPQPSRCASRRPSPCAGAASCGSWAPCRAGCRAVRRMPSLFPERHRRAPMHASRKPRSAPARP